MKKIIILLFALQSTFAQEITKSDLQKIVISFKLDTISYKIAGDGLQFLQNEMKASQYFMMGEYHNSALVSKFTQSLLSELKTTNYKIWVTEISPTSVKKLSGFLRSSDYSKNIQDFNIKYGKNNSPIPFFSLKADFEMLKVSHDLGFELWGIDQHFFGGFQFVMDDIYNEYDQKTKAENPTLLQDAGKENGDLAFSKLFDISKNRNAQAIKKEMLASIEIYNHYSQGNYYLNNTVRSSLMKTNFNQYYQDYIKKNKSEPKVFVKMGSNHVSKGLSSLGIADFGNAIQQICELKGQKKLNFQVCYRYEYDKGKLIDGLELDDYPKELLELHKDNEWIIMDLRSFQAKLYNLQLKKNAKIELSKSMINAIKQFDVLILSPEKVK